jgi:hypothetical protein
MCSSPFLTRGWQRAHRYFGRARERLDAAAPENGGLDVDNEENGTDELDEGGEMETPGRMRTRTK